MLMCSLSHVKYWHGVSQKDLLPKREHVCPKQAPNSASASMLPQLTFS